MRLNAQGREERRDCNHHSIEEHMMATRVTINIDRKVKPGAL